MSYVEPINKEIMHIVKALKGDIIIYWGDYYVTLVIVKPHVTLIKDSVSLTHTVKKIRLLLDEYSIANSNLDTESLKGFANHKILLCKNIEIEEEAIEEYD